MFFCFFFQPTNKMNAICCFQKKKKKEQKKQWFGVILTKFRETKRKHCTT